MKIPIYPEVKILQTTTTISFITKIVKKSENGKYYYWKFHKHYVCKKGEEINLTKRFYSEVYLTIVLGIITDKLVEENRGDVFELTKEQIPEEERLKKTLFL